MTLPHEPSSPASPFAVFWRLFRPGTTPPEVTSFSTNTPGDLKTRFVAFLPLEVFAYKLRGFMDDLGANIVRCDGEQTLLQFRLGSFFPKRKILLQIDTCCRDPDADYRAVDATVWSTNRGIREEELRRKGSPLLLHLRSYLMAIEGEMPDAARRALEQAEAPIASGIIKPPGIVTPSRPVLLKPTRPPRR